LEQFQEKRLTVFRPELRKTKEIERFGVSETTNRCRKEFAMTANRKWSADVTEHSDAMDLEDHVFESDDAKKIAASLKRSAEHSDRRKAEPFQSAMSMLNFYINRAGKNLPDERRKVLEKAKDELRAAFGRDKQD